MKKIWGLMLAGIVVLSQEVIAQSFAETAMLFSRTSLGGSARMQALGGAQTSLGGDLSSAYSNPAGLGMFNRSEVSISLGQYTSQMYNGNYMAGSNSISDQNSDSRYGVNIPSFGLVFSSGDNARGKFLRGTFAVTLNRINNFNRNVSYQGTNPATSLIDYFLEQATGGNPGQFDENGSLFNTVTELAYNNYLIGEATLLDPNNSPEDYFTDIQSVPFQAETIQTSGGQNQWSFSYGANFDDRFFLGAGLGIGSIRYQSQKTYREDFKNEPLSDFTLNETLDIRGSSVNLTVGGIARPVDFVQVGMSITTPTYYNLTDNYSAKMRSTWKNFDYYGDGTTILKNESSETDQITSEYTLRTPWRMNVGATFFIQKYGFVTADIEQVNYSRANYQSQISGMDFKSDNDKIRGLYRPVTNFRLGAEGRLNNWRARAGYQFMPDPFEKQQNGVDRSLTALSGGVGYKTRDYYIDLVLIKQTGNNSYRPYSVNSEDSPLLTYAQRTTSIMATVGFTF